MSSKAFTCASFSVSFTILPSSSALKAAIVAASASNVSTTGFTVSPFSSAVVTTSFSIWRVAEVVKSTCWALPVHTSAATVPVLAVRSNELDFIVTSIFVMARPSTVASWMLPFL